ncbi:MAG TPA: SMP-30/gluconolactonase/LRE family protein [Actinocrinis sp.]|nr:SMP-30/gluconolactonase/LRE family protein [Actinocrinis sp.]
MNRSLRTRLVVVGVTCVAAASLGAGIGSAASRSAQASGGAGADPDVTYASLFATVAPPDPGVFGTSLEGAAFDGQGRFYFVDTTAPAGQPKLMSLDLTSRAVTDLYTDSSSMLNCIGFGPTGTMYLCDLNGQRIVSYDAGTQKLSNVLTKVRNTPFVPDDIALTPTGDMYIADYQGTPTAPTGRILVRSADGTTKVALTGLSHPNGIVFSADYSGLWIDRDLSGTLDHVGYQYSSPASKTVTATLHTASYLSLGANAYTDSLTVDGAGNIYMGVYGAGEVLEFNPDGVQIGRVVFPSSVPRVTHVAIQPGTRDAYVTASGPGGGYIYTFQALAAAPAGMPNGG